MKQLTIEHLAPYWPHGPQMHFGKMMGFDLNYPVLAMHDNQILTYEEEGVNDITIWMDLNKHPYHRLILRPPSDLTKEINHRGEVFVPMQKLLEIFGVSDADTIKSNGKYHYAHYSYDSWRLGFHEGVGFYFNDPDSIWSSLSDGLDQMKLFNIIHSWMFDTSGLIPAGLAIDVNTLTENPYEK